jgi:hypothetical protein
MGVWGLTSRFPEGMTERKARAKDKMQGSLHCAFAESANAPVEMTTLCERGDPGRAEVGASGCWLMLEEVFLALVFWY